jgi:hypothetical protein
VIARIPSIDVVGWAAAEILKVGVRLHSRHAGGDQSVCQEFLGIQDLKAVHSELSLLSRQ